MELYSNLIKDKNKFSWSNKVWNDLGLNRFWSVGSTSSLIENGNFKTKEEWRDFYFNSGAKRLEILKTLPIDIQEHLQQVMVPTVIEESRRKTLNKFKSLNMNYGRTEAELEEKGRVMYEEIERLGNPHSITLKESIYLVKYRVIGETWNGVMFRERNTIEKLHKHFPSARFVKLEGSKDSLYAVDYEMYYGTSLICGLQIKPDSYKKSNNPALKSSKQLNNEKNTKYKNKFGRDVYYIYSSTNGDLSDTDVIELMSDAVVAFF